jgi:hypothetical protein
MVQAFGEALDVTSAGEGDHRYLTLQVGDLLIELPQLRDML